MVDVWTTATNATTGLMMNERIKLPAQEWLGYDPDRGDMHGYTFGQMREFSESIVYECIDLVLGSSLREDDMAAIIANKLKKYYGVAE
jgi:hypothetical protein